MKSQQEIDALVHVLWEKALPNPLRLSDSTALASFAEREKQRVDFLIELGKHCDSLGLNDPIETGLLNLQHFHPLDSAEMEDKLKQTGFPAQLSDQFAQAKLSLIRPEIYQALYPVSYFSDCIDAMKLEAGKDYLFDPYYGMLIVNTPSGIRRIGIALGSFMKYIESIPEQFRRYNLERPTESLMTGVRLSQLLFKDLLPADQVWRLSKDEVPEIVVHSGEAYWDLIGKILDKQKLAPKTEIWFRGQTNDYLMPDRSALAAAGVLPYSNVRDSSLVPSLYRSIDHYTNDPELYVNFVKHYGNWCLRAKFLFGTRCVVKREGQVIEDPSFNLPEGCTASVAMAYAGAAADESQVIDELGPYTTWTITNKDGEVVDTFTKYHFPAMAAYQANLVLQHYGCHTSALDITSDPKVAAWFATNRLSGPPNMLTPSVYNWSDKQMSCEWPTVFVMVLVPGIHPFLNSSEILRGTGALRPIRQSCGLLSGAGNLCRNYGARYISLKIRLSPDVQFRDLPAAAELFPSEHEDEVLKSLLNFEEKWAGRQENFFPVYKVEV